MLVTGCTATDIGHQCGVFCAAPWAFPKAEIDNNISRLDTANTIYRQAPLLRTLLGFILLLGRTLSHHCALWYGVRTYPRVVMVTMVYQNDAGMEVNVESDSLCKRIE